VLPGIVPIAAATKEEAEARLLQLNSFASLEHLIAKGSEFLGIDLRQVDLDKPLPEETNTAAGNQASKSRVAVLLGIARRDGLTVRQLLARLASGRGHFLAVGTGEEIAAAMREWVDAGAADGFNVMCPVLPGDLQSFADRVMPALGQRTR
jgi:alkanesulfonate monooxygenase SsuD/methylene tetrahydromethanopterin reductase-like flavin-dependent oxidoreductase (luciferase family)